MRASSHALITGAVQFDTRLILTFFASKGLVGSSPSYNLSVNGLSTSTLGPHLPNHWWVSLSFSISGDTFTTQPQTNERVRFIYTFFQTTSWPEYFFLSWKPLVGSNNFFFHSWIQSHGFCQTRGLKPWPCCLGHISSSWRYSLWRRRLESSGARARAFFSSWP